MSGDGSIVFLRQEYLEFLFSMNSIDREVSIYRGYVGYIEFFSQIDKT